MFIDLADEIQRLEFDQVFAIVDGHVLTVDHLYAPSVHNSDETDIELDDRKWNCFHGMTHQWGYAGAVMHPSENVSAAIAEKLYDYSATNAEDGIEVVFALVVVYGLDGGEDAGWAIAYRERKMRSKERNCQSCGTVWNSSVPVDSCKYDEVKV